MAEAILVSDQIEAGAEFAREFENFRKESVVFWVKPIDSEDWKLYIASDDIDYTNIDIAYREVLRISKPNMWLGPLQIKLVNTSEDIAAAAIGVRDRGGAKLAVDYGGSSLGGLEIDRAYIYREDLKTKAIY